MEQSIAAGAFKAKCLQLLDEVAHRQEGIVITKRGRPVARLVPLAAERPLHGALAGTARCDGDIVGSLAEVWDADQ